ncbi:non-specific lipid transfer protein GPI-anchored 12 [Arachis hypogaea]|uniref:Bifunctional inhibitor/plant lipid transfer protein/seed storage helical domain-containing protein n=1 Tax=Arachis hypogaea TaxID=3818 RepID=A0A445DKT7_ARAHY|nr:xylogen-like protein 11 [Arachis hypogaea]QHO36916.1 Non-specific lipid transfer protein GPI-anchored [Arachis hypogaea]RYR63841.1 hypothetical protein Ahy_A04g021594 [Arachis hypogaea]
MGGGCRVTVALAALVLAMAASCGECASPAAAPSPAENACFTALLNMSDCLTYVEDGSNETKPDKGCCPELAGLIDSNPICLCELLGNPDAVGIKIDLNRALKLPSVCRLTTPPVSTCSAVGVPVSLPPSKSASPSLAPKGSTANSSSGVAPSPGNASPSSNEAAASSPSGNKDNANGAPTIQASVLTFIFGFIVSVSMFF